MLMEYAITLAQKGPRIIHYQKQQSKERCHDDQNNQCIQPDLQGGNCIILHLLHSLFYQLFHVAQCGNAHNITGSHADTKTLLGSNNKIYEGE